MPIRPEGLTDAALHIAPLAQAETIPSAWYTDPAFDAFERDALFAHAWQYAGHESRLAHPGDFLALDVAENPVIVVRGKDDVLRAFHNVCRHRGGPLEMASCGRLRKGTVLQCQYHGWTYRLDGSLRGVPRFDRTDLFDKRDHGLVPISLAVWDGLVFVRLADDGPALAEHLHGIADRIAPMRLAPKRFFRQVVYEVAANWKVYVDNFLEGYHIPLVHPELCNVLDYRAYVTETHGQYSLQYSPIRDGAAQYGTADGDAFYYFIFPNIMLNILPGRLQMNRVEPMGPARCRVVFDYYYDDVTSPEALQAIESDLAFSDRVQAEDADICAHVQRGLGSRAYDQGRFSVDCEAGVHHFQSLLKQTFRAALGR